MARTPFRSRSSLSGPQPTHTSLGKASGSKWGTTRARAGQRVRRKGVFPSSDEEGGTGKAKGKGRKLVSSDDEDAEAASSKGQRAFSSRGSESRAFAALARNSSARRRSPRPDDSDNGDDEVAWSLGDKRLGRQRREVGSSDPDASLSEEDEDDSGVEVKVDPPTSQDAKKPSSPRADSPNAAEMRHLRAEAALKRLEKSKAIEVLDSTEEENVKQKELERVAAGPRRQKSVSPARGKKGKKGMQKGKGRCLADSDKNCEDVEQFRRRMRREADAKKKKDEEEDLKPLEFAATAAGCDSDGDLDPLDRASSCSTSTSARRRTHHRRTWPLSSSASNADDQERYDARALRRARTSGKSTSEFISDSDDERDAPMRGKGRWLETGGSTGRVTIGTTSSGGSVTGVKKPVEKKEKKVVELRRDDSSGHDSDNNPTSSFDYAHLNLPRFVDPRADLPRRKKRELSSPPTSAFESSDGEGPRVVGGREMDELDKFEMLDRRMKRKKAKYREERRPGYSNPRRN